MTALLLEAEAEDTCLIRLQLELENAEATSSIQRKELQRLQQEKAAAVQRVADLQALVADNAEAHNCPAESDNNMDIGHLQKSERIAQTRLQKISEEMTRVEAAKQACVLCSLVVALLLEFRLKLQIIKCDSLTCSMVVCRQCRSSSRSYSCSWTPWAMKLLRPHVQLLRPVWWSANQLSWRARTVWTPSMLAKRS